MSDPVSKTFYLETFGCQMNAHDSEKVVGTLLQQGYRQVPTVEEAGLVLYNTCSIRDKAEQRASTGFPITRNTGRKARYSASLDAWHSRKAKRSSSEPHTCLSSQDRHPTVIFPPCWSRLRQGTAPPDSTTARPTSASRPSTPPAPTRIAATSPSSKAATSSAPTA